MRSPLQGLRVLDLSRVLAGPWCAQILGDLGADVVKVEMPGEGDDSRQFGTALDPQAAGGQRDSSFFLSCNLSDAPTVYRAPPQLGQHTREVLAEWLGMDAAIQAQMFDDGAAAGP